MFLYYGNITGQWLIKCGGVNNVNFIFEESPILGTKPNSNNIVYKYHWLFSYVYIKSVFMTPIYYDNKKGDIFTNLLPKVAF